MRTQKIEGIIIKRRNIGEADRIITVFTKEQGKMQIKASGVRRIPSRRSPHVELLNLSLLTVYRGGGSPVLTEASVLDTFPEVKSNLRKIGLAYHVCELIDSLCPENQENQEIYFLLKDLLSEAFVSETIPQAIADFERKLLHLLGYWPENRALSVYQLSPFIESILERKLKARQILPRLL